MSSLAIGVDRIAKRYQIGSLRHDTLRDRLVHGFNSLWHRTDSSSGATGEFWALKDVSFEIRYGEIVGIIGRNGAGKSTLLKILSHITEPTAGRVEMYGRVGSLLEVGTGFHPELTGRENIYLNGAILGMTRTEIRRKFDEIVMFAEIEDFLDTPVKRYSSGMYVRLAFAVAAHLEPEILLVDEVLAVGDVAFQRKCLGKMSEIATEGRTVLFVSHNMAAVQSLCKRGIILQDGTVWVDDEIGKTVAAYLSALESSASNGLSEGVEREGKGEIKLLQVEITSEDDSSITALATGRPARFTFHLSALKSDTVCGFTVYDQFGLPITSFQTSRAGPGDISDPRLGNTYVCEFEELQLLSGRYRIDFAVWQGGELQDRVEAVAFFDVAHGQYRGRPTAFTSKWGSVTVPHRWLCPL